ncbi:alanine--tRNA ligase [Taibaiella sp. KBW10]|uniref:alanine--tRNA ligase n=1 Tax=Taibaiella sp. KBW10 TaxID=2153357 RepID=UPI000F5A5288|nr:alanine--tRNA ligase [Taibaiella sp. KBW10]RQO31879.1 alanine--tRNA ligase [Taibaiella sp. KBW10]
MTSSEIRQQFLDFFKSKEHTIVPSAPIVVKNDPTLLFINSGMAPFKDYFLGNKPAPHKRIADTQKCLRVSGKHNDLEEVGVDTYHHTMFEMLGNWSFGDYFKKEAIAWSWELLTEVYKLDKDKLYVTVFEGDEKEGLSFDQEAYDEWKKYIAEDRILKGNKKDNFWEMGDTGPCGPCSEIHVDCRSEEERKTVNGADLVNADHPQVIEIWNNVFMEFNRLKDGSLQKLPAQHVDTGMGFERLVRVLQSKQSNYDTDVFTGTIAAIEKITKQTYDRSDSKEAVAFRVLSDHIRAISFTIADGQLPSNTGAGYVIRRILRRAVRYYYSYLGYKSPLLFQLIPTIAAQFEQVFPELKQQEDFVTKVIREEEDAFLRTLEKGLKKMDDIIEKEKNSKLIGGKEAFELYDTYGFPLDLTRLIAVENELNVDEKGFEAEMLEQKNRSRKATAIDAEDWTVLKDAAKTSFVGYDDLNIMTQVVKYRKVTAKNKEQFQIVLEATPFYAESGGQVGDRGVLVFGTEEIEVTDTKKENDLIIHFADKLPADINAEVNAKVDFEKRLFTMYNHTATHLLHAALKQVLGAHVNQKGSLVNEDILRFDVSHFAKVTDEELKLVMAIVNQKIRENIPVVIKEMPKEEALKSGAMALFGEKYGDTVRVVTIDPEFSVELCGGTHVGYTGMLGSFVITAESAVAAGVRRIEALTGGAAFRYFADRVEQTKVLVELLKTKDPIKTIEKLLEDKAALEKKVEAYEAKELALVAKALASKAEEVNGVQYLGQHIEVSSLDALKKVAFDMKLHLKNYLVVLTANIGGKASVAIAIEDALATAKDLDAGKIIKQHIAPLIKGGGGGQKALATAGGQDVSQLNEVLAVVKSLL